MPIAILINFLFIFFLFLSSFSLFSLLKCFGVMYLKKKEDILKWKKNKMILICDFIPYTFKKFKFKFYHSTKEHAFSFWPCYIRYTLLVIDKFRVEFSFLMPLLHLSLEPTYRFIHLRHFFTIAFFIFFLINIRFPSL